MHSLKLHLFGAPHFEIDGKVVDGVRRKAVALAAYLALTDRPQTRELLATLLWPDQDAERGRTSLRTCLHNLTSLSPLEWMTVDRQMVILNSEAIDIDTKRFLDALAGARVHTHGDGHLCQQCETALLEAVALYEDDFLAGFSLSDSVEFDNWQITQREWLNRECTFALQRLAEHTAHDDPQKATDYAHRWLAISPLDEQAHRLLMHLYAATGRRAEALRQYQECVRLLDEELATLPENETLELYEVIRSGEVSTSFKRDARTLDNLGVINVLPTLPTLVIGREEALLDLKSRVGIPSPETRRALTVIEGWPGVGKSTTIGLLAHDAELKTAFPDGILWTSLGENPNLLSKLMVWGEALHLIPPGKTPTLEDLTGQITSVLQDRQMILIIDDVWQVEHAAPFRVGGQDSVMVMSSRLSNIARSLAPTSGDVYRLPVLSDKYAFSLLERLAPQAVQQHPEEALELIHDLEGLPLAIQVAGRLLHEEMTMGWGITELLEELRSGANLLSAPIPSDLVNEQGYTAPTVMALLKRSTDSLDEDTLFRFALLSLFSAKPATFDLAAMAVAWAVDDPKPTIRKLVNRGLLEPISRGRFQMHALLVLHAKALLDGVA